MEKGKVGEKEMGDKILWSLRDLAPGIDNVPDEAVQDSHHHYSNTEEDMRTAKDEELANPCMKSSNKNGRLQHVKGLI